MKPGKTREQLEGLLIEPLMAIKRNRVKTDRLKQYLFNNHKMLEGNVQSWINNPRGELSHVQWETLYLVAMYTQVITGDDRIDPDHFFTDVESRRAKLYQGEIAGDISLPYTFKKAVELEFGTFLTSISVKDLAQLSSSLLNYNFNIQREATNVKRNGETIQVATLVKSNVLEMKEHLKNGTLFPTSIVINAKLGSSDDEEEMFYDPETGDVTISDGTILDIVDGFHRCKASELAINENPNIDFNFAVLLLNMTDSQAANYQAQLAKSTPISRHKQTQLESSRRADEVANYLMRDSELQGRVSMKSRLSQQSGELISYSLIADTIHREFDLPRNIDVHRVGSYLKDVIDWLFGIYEEEFSTDITTWSKKSVINSPGLIASYISLAAYMYKEKIEAREIVKAVENIDFSRDNGKWQELGVLSNQKYLSEPSIATVKRVVEMLKKELEKQMV